MALNDSDHWNELLEGSPNEIAEFFVLIDPKLLELEVFKGSVFDYRCQHDPEVLRSEALSEIPNATEDEIQDYVFTKMITYYEESIDLLSVFLAEHYKAVRRALNDFYTLKHLKFLQTNPQPATAKDVYEHMHRTSLLKYLDL